MNRRLFLKASCGTSLSLPLFAEEKNKTQSSSRLLIFCNHLGFILPNLVPESGNIKDSSPYLDLFKKYHDRMTVLTNMTYKGVNPGIHKTPRSLLTGTANGYDPKYYPSIDQFLAPHLQKNTSHKNIQASLV